MSLLLKHKKSRFPEERLFWYDRRDMRTAVKVRAEPR